MKRFVDCFTHVYGIHQITVIAMKNKENNQLEMLTTVVDQAISEIYDDTPPAVGCCWNCRIDRGGRYTVNGKLFCNRSCEENWRWAGL